MISVFLSYARLDDEPFVRRLSDNLKRAGFGVWFDRESMPSRGLTFTKEIEDAIAERDRFLLVVGPAVLASNVVQREYGFALRTGKPITPIIRIGDSKNLGRDLPAELKLLDARDFTDDDRYGAEFERLVTQISEPPAGLGKLIAVPPLPRHFLKREESLKKLKNALQFDILRAPRDLRGRVIGITGVTRTPAALRGMGGLGKSVLARTLLYDVDIRRNFPDGLAFVAFGQTPDLAARIRTLLEALGGDPNFVDFIAGQSRLRELLAEKAVLLLLDDVWDPEHARAFDLLGPRCQLLITTRSTAVVESLGGTAYAIELLSEAESRSLLASWAGTLVSLLPQSESKEIVRRCGGLPLALAICGAMIRDRSATWSFLVDAFREADVDYLACDHGPEGYEHPGITQAIQISVRALSTTEQQRFAELSVFRPDMNTPIAAVSTLWAHTSGMHPRYSRQLLAKFASRSLVEWAVDESLQDSLASDRSDDVALVARTPSPSFAAYTQHDLLHMYATRMTGDSAALNASLVDAYRAACPAGFATGPNDGYFFEHLIEHLAQLPDISAATSVALSFSWLAAKLSAAGSANLLLGDYALLIEAHPDRLAVEAAKTLDDFRRFVAKEGLRLTKRPESALSVALELPPGSAVRERALLAERDPSSRAAFLFHRINPPVRDSNPCLVQVFSIDSGINAVAISNDRRVCIVSLVSGPVQVWDLPTPRLRYAFPREGVCAVTLQISADGSRAVSLDDDGKARLWNLVEEDVRVLDGPAVVTHIAANSDCSFVLLAGRSNEFILWNIEQLSSRPLSITSGTVEAISVSSDAQRIMIADWNYNLTLLDVRSLDVIASGSWNHRGISQLTLSADAGVAVGVFDNGNARGGMMLRWETTERRGHAARHRQYEDPDDKFRLLRISSDAKRALVSHWRRLVLWDLETGKRLLQLRGPMSNAGPIALSPDARSALSTEVEILPWNPSTIHVWDLEAVPATPQVDHSTGVAAAITAVAIAPNGSVALSAAGNSLTCWDVATGKRRFRWRWLGRVCALAMSNEMLAISADDAGEHYDRGGYENAVWVRLLDLRTGQEVRRHSAHDGPIYLLHINDEGTVALSGNGFASDDCDRIVNRFTETSLVRWNLTTGKTKRLHGSWFKQMTGMHGDIIPTVAIPPGDSILIDRRIWSLKRLALVRKFEQISDVESPSGPLSVAAVSADGRVIAGGVGSCCTVWSAADGNKRGDFHLGDSISSLALDAAGEYLLVGSGAELSFWDVRECKMLCVIPCEHRINSVALTRHAPFVACAGGESGNMLIYKIKQQSCD